MCFLKKGKIMKPQLQLVFWSIVAGVFFVLLSNESKDPMVRDYMVAKAKMNAQMVAVQK